ncbi:2-oxo-4-hydroxy-4-carboxy-5-ureidoimidazoline decarboxylase [Microbacterium sp. NPDC076911]|uniref:2-oxo-4-hydroxy-4-carboxy-5-ureidoimidazoline decarboxylase n=1 Tax=Microbacterium sp. NPDC076911 TaxID=3154958 RepID=UPI00341C4896
MNIDDFNVMAAADAIELALTWAAVAPWAHEIVGARPYDSAAELEGFASLRAQAWTRADLDAALERHPRIGEKPIATGAEADASRREQASMADADASVASRIAAGNTAYETQFGRVFLIRAAGRSPAEMLGELERRLRNDDDTEASEAVAQLAEIALLRLTSTMQEPTAAHSLKDSS